MIIPRQLYYFDVLEGYIGIHIPTLVIDENSRVVYSSKVRLHTELVDPPIYVVESSLYTYT